MQVGFSSLRAVLVSTLCAVVLVGCVSQSPAPVEVRAPSRPVAVGDSAAPAVARPGYYIVKKGDTLYSIAHANDRDYRELAVWNGLSDPSLIKVGQELRVQPQVDLPSTDLAVVPVAPAVVIDSKPVIGSTPIVSAPVASEPVSASLPAIQKTEPKGGRMAYSVQAWKDLQTAEKQPSVAAPAAQSQPVAQSRPAEVKPAEAKPVSSAADEETEWVWPGAGKVLATFNDNTNKGVDLAGAIGDPVLAAGSGKVVYVGAGLRGYGNMVILKHNNAFLSAYAHNSEVLVKEGQSVQKGQKIAALGNSDSDRPKLHFEIRRQGKPVDPLKYLPPR
jgi:lipoprotein NlpD